MTIAEKFRHKGLHEGMVKVARKMLMQKKDIEEIIELTELSREEIAEIKRSMKK